MKKNAHCCELMDFLVQDPKMPLKYYPITREYGITLRGSSAIQCIDYCPWCGKKLPKDLRDVLYDTIKKEYALEADFGLKDDPNIPEEFKSDAWWKKRGL